MRRQAQWPLSRSQISHDRADDCLFLRDCGECRGFLFFTLLRWDDANGAGQCSAIFQAIMSLYLWLHGMSLLAHFWGLNISQCDMPLTLWLLTYTVTHALAWFTAVGVWLNLVCAAESRRQDPRPIVASCYVFSALLYVLMLGLVVIGAVVREADCCCPPPPPFLLLCLTHPALGCR